MLHVRFYLRSISSSSHKRQPMGFLFILLGLQPNDVITQRSLSASAKYESSFCPLRLQSKIVIEETHRVPWK